MPEKSCYQDKETDCLKNFQSGTISKVLTENPGKGKSISLLADSHAQTLVPPTPRKKVSTEKKADSGKKWQESFAKWDQNGSLWRMSQASSSGELTAYSGTWPKWGTMLNGQCWEEKKLEFQCEDQECGYWRPATVVDSCGRGYHGKLTGKYWLALPGQICKYLGLPVQCPQTGLIMPWVYEELMGWPIGWTALDPLEMAKLQDWLQLHSSYCLDSGLKEGENE